ncbi:hypothetical protein CCASEI_00375 [Corynebacterium casei LMG S-19264]|uniref:Uncharacterized protein n=1 Tax=Corynebacterium casei LMG S-19264 TaxID=1285583 RepID=A0ABN4C7V7_9CORY|nr:hypothetical protein CCASEI_00375 [Corynebacterium casei LMG S-19264]
MKPVTVTIYELASSIAGTLLYLPLFWFRLILLKSQLGTLRLISSKPRMALSGHGRKLLLLVCLHQQSATALEGISKQ